MTVWSHPPSAGHPITAQAISRRAFHHLFVAWYAIHTFGIVAEPSIVLIQLALVIILLSYAGGPFLNYLSHTTIQLERMMAIDGVYKSPARSMLSYVPWLPIVLGLVAIICTGIWHHYSSLALIDTKIIAALISIPPPAAFERVLPGLMAASLAMVIVLTIAIWAVYGWRALQQISAQTSSQPNSQRLRPFVIVSGVTNALLYGLLIWYCVMFALSLLWLGGGMIASKATMDGANTLTVVDETLPKLIKSAMGIDPAKQGYLVHVGGRDVDIGKSSCSLFCFTLARAMLADTIDCTCDAQLAEQLLPAAQTTHDIADPQVCTNTPVMCSINAYAFALYKSHMLPAVVCIMLALLSVTGMLMLLSGTFARVLSEQQLGNISRCSSADVQMQVDGSDSATPCKSAV